MRHWSALLRRNRVLKSQGDTGLDEVFGEFCSYNEVTGSFVQASSERVEGYMLWPVDPFYRPTVALFVGGLLTSITPTFRHLSGETDKASWVCVFNIRLPEKPSKVGDRLLLCLETGAVLFDERLSGGVSTYDIEQLLAEGLTQRSPWDASGFTAFLRLPVFDQLDLLYRDFLGRGIDQDGFQNYLRELKSGRSTILGVRDKLLESEEFRLRSISPYDQFGKWIVWGGLNTLCQLPMVTGTRASSLSCLDVVTPQVPLSDTLASISLGQQADVDTRRLWVENHSQFISQITRTLKARRDRAESCAEPGELSTQWNARSDASGGGRYQRNDWRRQGLYSIATREGGCCCLWPILGAAAR